MIARLRLTLLLSVGEFFFNVLSHFCVKGGGNVECFFIVFFLVVFFEFGKRDARMSASVDLEIGVEVDPNVEKGLESMAQIHTLNHRT